MNAPLTPLQTVTLEELEAQADAFDAVVHETPDIDPFCSSSDWILPAWEAWGAELDTWIRRGESGWAVFCRHADIGGRRALLGFDTMWGFSCPLVGPDPAALVEDFARTSTLEHGWDVALLPGLVAGSRLWVALIKTLGELFRLGRGPALRRWVASLDGGIDGFLARRSAKFRRNLRAAQRRAEDAGIAFERHDAGSAEGCDRLFERILGIEGRSWKGPVEAGLIADDIRVFYRAMAGRLAAKGRLRVTFARRDDVDVGYILGGVRDGIYRGFQFSFDAEVTSLSIGNLLQHAEITALCAEGVRSYDLGMDLDYKRHWADESFDTVTLAVMRIA